MFNVMIVGVIIYLIVSGGRNGWYNKRQMNNGYGRNNRRLSRGHYSEYGGYGGSNGSRFDEYNSYEKDYGGSSRSGGWGGSSRSNDNWGSNDSWGNSNNDDPWSKNGW